MIDKPALRPQMRALRRTLAERAPDAALRLASHVQTLLDAVSGPSGRQLTVALYRPRGAEIDPTLLAQALADFSCDLCLPVVIQHDGPLIFRAWTPGEPLLPDLVGSAAPPPESPTVDPHLILCPLLAFDSSGGRLGQGGGYYDRTFAERPASARIGLAYAGQEQGRIPLDPHDIPLHGVLTETGYTPAISR